MLANLLLHAYHHARSPEVLRLLTSIPVINYSTAEDYATIAGLDNQAVDNLLSRLSAEHLREQLGDQLREYADIAENTISRELGAQPREGHR